MRTRLLLLLPLPLLVLGGCGGPPTGDAPEAAGGRTMSSLPPSPTRDLLQGIRQHRAKRF